MSNIWLIEKLYNAYIVVHGIIGCRKYLGYNIKEVKKLYNNEVKKSYNKECR